MSRDDDGRRGSRDRDDDRGSRGHERDSRDSGSRRGGGRESGSRGSGFRYQERDPANARRRAEGHAGSGESFLSADVKMFKPAEGKNVVRILPPTWDGAQHHGLDIHVHYSVGPDNGAYLCLAKMKSKPCPVCDERKRAIADDDTEYADSLRPSQRILQYVVDRNKEREGALAWTIGYRMDSDIMRLAVDDKSNETLRLDDPENGYDLLFTREGQGLKTRYSGMQISRRSSALDSDDALEFAVAHPLPEQMVYFSYDHIAALFTGKGKPKDDDDDDKRGGGKRDSDDTKHSRRDRDEPSKDSRRKKTTAQPPDGLTFEDVQGMTFKEMAALIDDHDLDINPDSTRDDEELANQFCEAFELVEQKRSRSRSARDDDDDPPPKDVRRERLRSARDER